MELSIKGLQEAQRANLQMIMAMRPSSALGRAVKYAALTAHRHAVPSTPHEHGALRAAHRVKVAGLRARIYIDPGATAPRRKVKPSVYGAHLHGQGMRPGLRSGVRAFYQYTVETYGAKIGDGAIRIVKARLP